MSLKWRLVSGVAAMLILFVAAVSAGAPTTMTTYPHTLTVD